jgi:superfamily II DNA or RNA helicase
VVEMVVQIQMDEIGASYYDPNAACGVAGVATLIRREKKLDGWLPHVKMSVFDECFVAGTLVDGRPIEDVKVGDIVTGFDETTGTFGSYPVTHVFKNAAPFLLRGISIEGQREIYSTMGHPYWARQGKRCTPGWVEAEHILGGMEVCDFTRKRWAPVKGAWDCYMPNHPGNGYVYNLEVAEVSTYTANGIVVHNCHHLQKKNQWGKAHAMMPNAHMLGVTATACRADGHGLGTDNDGLFDALVVGPGMRDLINMGALSEYRVFAPPSDLDLNRVDISKATGDYNKGQLNKEVKRSHLVGDVVEQYLKIARGKLGVTFTNSVENAVHISCKFNEAGVRAEVVSAKTPDRIRQEFIRRLRNRELDQLVNVDLFGEGFDLPAIEVVSMARPTQSFAVFAQQFGRSLRPIDGKVAIIIDHVGNTSRHGLPDAPREWSLGRKERGMRSKRDPNVMPVTTCTACFSQYEAIHRACPFCGRVNVPAGRSSPEQVDGDLYELDAQTLAEMRGEVHKVDVSESKVREWLDGQSMTHAVKGNILKNHLNRQRAQAPLREAIAWWAGAQRLKGKPDSESYRRFFHTFGVDVSTAQTLGKADAFKLTDKIWRSM